MSYESMNIHVQVFLSGHMFSVFLSIYLGVELLRLHGKSMFNL